MKKFVVLLAAALILYPGLLPAQTKAEPPTAAPPPAAAPQQPAPGIGQCTCPCMMMMKGQMTPEMQKQMQERMAKMGQGGQMCPMGSGGQMCTMPGMGGQDVQKQLADLGKRVEALENQLKKKK